MWAKTMHAVMAIGALACGRGERQAEQPPAAGQDTSAAVALGPVVEVRMTGNSRDRSAYEPSRVTIAPGSTVRFINVSGGPHNVAFWADSIPSGAKDLLNSALPNRMGDLAGPFLVQPNQTYDVVFPANAAPGAYKGYCTPHLMQGMRITVTVE